MATCTSALFGSELATHFLLFGLLLLQRASATYGTTVYASYNTNLYMFIYHPVCLQAPWPYALPSLLLQAQRTTVVPRFTCNPNRAHIVSDVGQCGHPPRPRALVHKGGGSAVPSTIMHQPQRPQRPVWTTNARKSLGNSRALPPPPSGGGPLRALATGPRRRLGRLGLGNGAVGRWHARSMDTAATAAVAVWLRGARLACCGPRVAHLEECI